MKDTEVLVHTFEPVYDEKSEILVLGTFPSVKSRAANFYYGHPQNRFWRLIAALAGKPVPVTIAEKKELLLVERIAIWDVVGSCRIIGSSDASIRDVKPNDIGGLLSRTAICKIFANGTKAYELYQKHVYPLTKKSITALPSTSPANAACGFEKLYEIWKMAMDKHR